MSDFSSFNLTQQQLEQLLRVGDCLELKKDALLIQEGAIEKSFYYLAKGQLGILKSSGSQNHQIAILNAGEFVGELALLDDAPRATSVICLEDSQLYQFDIQKLKTDPAMAEIINAILNNIGGQLAKRLRYTNEVTVAALKSKIAMSLFSVRMLILLAIYTLSLNLLDDVKQLLPNSTLISLVLIMIFAVGLLTLIPKSGYPLTVYGLTKKNALKNITEAALFSLPIMGLILGIKWLAITCISSLQHFPLFDYAAMFKLGVVFNLKIYLLSLWGYILFCPVQEFIVRGCIQSSLQHLLEGKNIKWQAIIVSNLLFASTHVHTSLGFALAAFIPGLFWGWLYYRQRSLLGVSVSHILIGVWAAFIVGFQNII